jgi:hypothetical protein
VRGLFYDRNGINDNSRERALSNTWKQELVITDYAVYGEVLRVPKRIKMSLPYDRIAQVNIVRGIFTADIEIVNKGGTDNLVVRAISKREAEAAKKIMEQRINSAPAAAGRQGVSVADELKKLAELRAQGLLTEDEFQGQKRKLLT